MQRLDFAELRRTPHWSFSALNSVLNICNLQYAMRKIYKVTPEFVPINLVFGTAFHKALGFLYSSKQMGFPVTESQLSEFFAESLKGAIKESKIPTRFKEGEDVDTHMAKGSLMTSAFLESIDPEEHVIGTDIAFKVDLKDKLGNIVSKPLIGEYDAVVMRDDKLVIVDFKTSANKWPSAKAHSDLQATAYLYAERTEVKENSSLFRYDVVTKTKTPTVARYLTNRTQDDFDRFIELVKVADRIVENELFYPSETSFACNGCPYGGACSNWQNLNANSVVA